MTKDSKDSKDSNDKPNKAADREADSAKELTAGENQTRLMPPSSDSPVGDDEQTRFMPSSSDSPVGDDEQTRFMPSSSDSPVGDDEQTRFMPSSSDSPVGDDEQTRFMPSSSDSPVGDDEQTRFMPSSSDSPVGDDEQTRFMPSSSDSPVGDDEQTRFMPSSSDSPVGDDEQTRFMPSSSDSPVGDDEQTRFMPSSSDSPVGDDEQTRFMPSSSDSPVGDDEQTRFMPSSSDSPVGDDEQTRFMPSSSDSPVGDDEQTRFMPSSSDSPVGDDEQTRLMSSSSDSPIGDDELTRLMSSNLDSPSAEDELTRLMSSSSDSSRGEDSEAPIRPANNRGSREDTVRQAADLSAKEGGDSSDDTSRSRTNLPPSHPSLDVNVLRNEGKTVLNNRFVFDKQRDELGKGGMGTVYKAKDLRKVEAQSRDPWVAIKLLNEDFKTRPESFISLQREAQKSQILHHDNIIRVFDFDKDGDTVYMVMELLKGAELKDYIAKNPTGVDLEEAVRLTRQMGDALSKAHYHRITHSDFKPGNVFLTEDGSAKVLDFGIARAAQHVEVDGSKAEETVFNVGDLGAYTPAYASLRMLKGEEPEPSDDIYALGCVCYELLTGKHPYNKVPANVALEEGITPAKPVRLPPDKWPALRRAISLKKEDNFENVEDFLDEFAPTPQQIAAERQRVRTKRALIGIAAVVSIIAVGVGVIIKQSSNARSELDDLIEQERDELVAEIAEVTDGKSKALRAVIDGKFDDMKVGVESMLANLDGRLLLDDDSGWRDQDGIELDVSELLCEIRKVYHLFKLETSLALPPNLSPSAPCLPEFEYSEPERFEEQVLAFDNWAVVKKSELRIKYKTLRNNDFDFEKDAFPTFETERASLLNHSVPDFNRVMEVFESKFIGFKQAVSFKYLDLADANIEKRSEIGFEEARVNIETAERYDDNSSRLGSVRAILDAVRESFRINQQEIAELRLENDRIALVSDIELRLRDSNESVIAEYDKCSSGIDPTGRRYREFKYEMSGLKTIMSTEEKRITAFEKSISAFEGAWPEGQNPDELLTGFRKNQTAYVENLVRCIELYGFTDPGEARIALEEAADKFFPEYADGYLNKEKVDIKAWDGCRAIFAGRGDGYECRDKLIGPDVKEGPILMVAEAKEGLPAFAIGKYEVSELEFDTFCNERKGACTSPGLDEPDMPVRGRTFAEVEAYLAWLSDRTEFDYRLPTLEEWRWAASSGHWDWSPDDDSDSAAWVVDPISRRMEEDVDRNCEQKIPMVLGAIMLPATTGNDNTWGLVNHIGNAKELVAPSFGPTVRADYGVAGGSHEDNMSECRVETLVILNDQSQTDELTSFRVARELR